MFAWTKIPWAAGDLDILKQARALWNAGQTNAALEHFREAADSNPRNVRALIEFAGALGKKYHVGEASRLLEQARQIAGDHPEIQSKIARCYVGFSQLAKSLECLEAIPLESRTPLIWGELAVYYEQMGRFDDAEDAINFCIDDAPDQLEPQLILARLLAHQGEYERAYSVLAHLLKRSRTQQPLLRIRALYRMGLVLDQLGEYGKAVAFVEQAKTIQKKIPNAEALGKKAFAQKCTAGSVLSPSRRRHD